MRKMRQHPFGLAPGSPQPVPAAISSQSAGLTASNVLRAFLARSAPKFSSISLLYGDSSDLSAMVIEVATDFSRHYRDSNPIEYELGRAHHRDSSREHGKEYDTDPISEPTGPFGHGVIEISVEGNCLVS